MLPTGEVEYLLEATRSSVKRFGDDGAEDVKRLLQRKSFVGDEAAVRSILADRDGRGSVLAELHARLVGLIDAACGRKRH